MTYFLYRLLALSILAGVLAVALAAVGAPEATQVDLTLLLISMTLAGIGLVLTVSRDLLAARAVRRRLSRHMHSRRPRRP
jgi:glucose-6-phosphate-specific signal transduction histidine kinase